MTHTRRAAPPPAPPQPVSVTFTAAVDAEARWLMGDKTMRAAETLHERADIAGHLHGAGPITMKA